MKARFRNVPVQGATIGGQVTTGTREMHTIIKRHPPAKRHIKPYRVFSAWVKYHQPPWLFFIELAILILFFVLAFSIQQTTIPFFQDFGQAVDNYFLSGYDEISTDEQDDSYGDRRIYTKSMFLHVLNSTISRYFEFTSQFPCSYQLKQITNLTISIEQSQNSRIQREFSEHEQAEALNYITHYLNDFSAVRLRMLFQIEQTQIEKAALELNAGVTSNFDNYQDTGIILWNNGHERSSRQIQEAIPDTVYNLSTSVSLIIIMLLSIGIILQSTSIWSLYKYSEEKALEERISSFDVFCSKLDTWEPVTLVFNLISMILMIIYVGWGHDVNENVPWPHFLLAAASFIHAFLLFRYLVLRPSTLIVVRMISGASITLAQFVVGCAPFFCGFIIVGTCWFGWYSPLMTSPRQAAKFLIAASYGDYLLDGYDDMCDGADKPAIIPSAYLTIWIFNGLGIWFYVVLAILHAALIKEVHKARDEEADQGIMDEDPLPWLQFIMY